MYHERSVFKYLFTEFTQPLIIFVYPETANYFELKNIENV